MIGVELEGADEIAERTAKIMQRMVNVSAMTRYTTTLQIRNLRRYDNNAGPDGRFWRRLAPSTIDQKHRGLRQGKAFKYTPDPVLGQGRSAHRSRWGSFSPSAQPKLVFTGLMRSSFKTAVFGRKNGSSGRVANFVPYAGFHQTGTSRMPARPPLGVDHEDVKVIRRIACQIFDAARSGREGV